jgi:hypothetical protein
MITIEKVCVFNWGAAIRGLRNPMNSWDKSDSYETHGEYGDQFFFGESDLALAKKLTQAGPDHRKFLRQIMVSMDITAPLYWWKEYDTYKVGTVANSCSTMHKIHAKDFVREDFSCDMMDEWGLANLDRTIRCLNTDRRMYVDYDNIVGSKMPKKHYWYQMIQTLPSSYNQMRTVTMTYENLLNMYRARKDHKLDEWRKFCDAIADLPYFKEVIGC